MNGSIGVQSCQLGNLSVRKPGVFFGLIPSPSHSKLQVACSAISARSTMRDDRLDNKFVHIDCCHCLRFVRLCHIEQLQSRGMEIDQLLREQILTFISASMPLHDDKRATPSWCRSEEHTSEPQSLIRLSYADFCLQNKHP